MTMFSKILLCGTVMTMISATPAVAQYYPPSGYGYPYAGNVVSSPPGGYGYGYGYGPNRQIAINQCASAAQARLGATSRGRVLGISDARVRGDGGIMVRGVATSGRYPYAYGMQSPVDLTWSCLTDFRGFVVDVNIGASNYGTGYNYKPWDNDYSQFGYRRY